ncbi:TetR/AcrR family transcriptional regulator [Alkaliphilus oremlandii]|uniref:Transcriptional regulator, TetR family n=1 Tax=Alkaliphilus oremlandii (strain OhILAs) TaxID=350688 RepID=A8MK19_ALKOO|nr:TetR/AcrR family transcriptional regulator [Alkaliphilus oremlandii]ABW20151.1 transcriptional regulator, TetR family [Alkaliphilus oremlandii OhILAs]
MNQSKIKYNRLIEKAEELFVNLGYKAVSMDQIAEAAGISKMTIYRYFSSKEELFLKVLDLITARMFGYIEDNIKDIEGTLNKIDGLLKINIEQSRKYSLAFYKDVMEMPYILDKVMKEKKRMATILFEDIIREGMERGEIRQVDEGFVANVLISLMDGFARNFEEISNTKEDIEAFAEKFYDFLKYGLFGRK